MPTLSTVVSRQPIILQNRYQNQWVNWTNSLLEELAGRGFTMPTLHKESGFTVDNDVWITLPSTVREVIRVFNPDNVNQEYNFKRVNGKLKLVDIGIDSAIGDNVTIAGTPTTTYFDISETDKEENAYKNYLFVVTDGTLENNTYIIASSDESDDSVGTTRLYLLNELTTPFTISTANKGDLISPDDYVMVEYSDSYSEITSLDDEIPIDNRYERRVTDAYFTYRAERELDISGRGASVAFRNYKNVLNSIITELRGTTGGRVRPRQSAGFTQYSYGSGYIPKSVEETSDD